VVTMSASPAAAVTKPLSLMTALPFDPVGG